MADKVTKTKDYAIIIGKRNYGDDFYLTAYNKKIGKFDLYLCGFKNRGDYDCCTHGDIIEYEATVTKFEQYTDIGIKFIKNISHEQRCNVFDKAYTKFIPLYAGKVNVSGYICRATGNECKIATDHFKKLKDTMEQSAKDGRTFVTKECNLCTENDCPIYHKYVLQRVEEFSKEKVR